MINLRTPYVARRLRQGGEIVDNRDNSVIFRSTEWSDVQMRHFRLERQWVLDQVAIHGVSALQSMINS